MPRDRGAAYPREGIHITINKCVSIACCMSNIFQLKKLSSRNSITETPRLMIGQVSGSQRPSPADAQINHPKGEDGVRKETQN